jgi:nucleoside-diphosphate-sugar epimerase
VVKASPPRLLILGAGFLGREVARQAKAGGWSVFPVVRTEDSAQELRSFFPAAQATDGLEARFWGELIGEWGGLVWSMSPSRKLEESAFEIMHRQGVFRAAEWAKKNSVPFVYLSSTSVYAESEGGWVDELSPTAQDDPRAQVMVTAERATLQAGGSVLRCAGLYGMGRELRTNAGGPKRWLNVIHVEDAARAVGVALRRSKQIFNACEDYPLARGTPGGVWDEKSVRSRRSKRVQNGKLRDAGWIPLHRAN